MRTAGLALLIALVVASVATVGDGPSEPPTAKTTLPANPFAKSRDGDWSAYVERITERGRPPRSQVALWRVLSIEGDRVTTRLDVRDGADARWVPGNPRAFSRTETPTVEELFAIPGVRSRMEDVRVSDESVLFEKRSFPCKRITFTCRGDDERDGSAQVLAWFTDAIPASALIGIRIQAKDATTETTIEYDLVGFGRGATVEMGRAPEEVDLDGVAVRR
jgi:hypothetical protein